MSNPAFDRYTDADVVAEYWKDQIKGKNVIVTGATGESLGFEAARVIAKHGANLVILCGRGQDRLALLIWALWQV